MEKIVLVTINSTPNDFVPGTPALPSGITIPSDLLELIDILNPFGDRLKKEDVTTVMQAARTFGIGRIYYRLGGTWIIGEAPNAGDIYTVVYYAEIGPLVNGTDENIITDIAPDLIIYKALTFAGDFFVDKRTPTWEQRYQSIAQTLQGMADADELSGDACVGMPIYWPDDGVAYGYP